jgi:RNA polymerase sigma-70 factor (ECF subfamily)
VAVLGASRVEIDPRVRAAAAGDRAAAHALLLALLPRVRNLVRYLIRGDSDTDDLAQEALIAILRGLGSFRGESSFERWADRVAVRAVFAGIRRRRRESNDLAAALPELRLASPGVATPADEFADRRQAAALLDALPLDQRYAMVMHHVLGMSVPEIARELGVPAETVRSRLRLGRTRLRELGMSTEEDGTSPAPPERGQDQDGTSPAPPERGQHQGEGDDGADQG